MDFTGTRQSQPPGWRWAKTAALLCFALSGAILLASHTLAPAASFSAARSTTPSTASSPTCASGPSFSQGGAFFFAAAAQARAGREDPAGHDERRERGRDQHGARDEAGMAVELGAIDREQHADRRGRPDDEQLRQPLRHSERERQNPSHAGATRSLRTSTSAKGPVRRSCLAPPASCAPSV